LQKLREQPQSSIDMLIEIAASLDAVARWQPAAQDLAQRLESIRIEAEDIASEMERLERETQYDESRIGELTDQLDALNRLLAKHRFNDASELNAFKEELENKLLSIDTESHDLSELEGIVESAGKEVTRLAEKLTKARKKAVSPFVKKVNALLEDVGMPGASLEVEISPMEEAGQTGADKVRFLFASNAGTKPSSLRQVASGGELSRLMLCIKSLLASKSQMPTLIFDEIDTGVSGETGLRIGKLMEELASDHQIIAITHLPQIAAAGEHHLFVYKQQSGKKVESMIRSLEESERVEQIARMISGDTPSEAARRNARELLGQE
jgi:DNA repair protein RecN (Recombination protein N)